MLNRQKLTTEEVKNILHISGYKLFLPTSWYVHGQARILMYAKDDIDVIFKENKREYNDLQSISCEVGISREKKTVVNLFYREFTGCVSGLDSKLSQNERLCRQIRLWNAQANGSKDTVSVV